MIFVPSKHEADWDAPTGISFILRPPIKPEPMCYSIAYLEQKAEKLQARYRHMLPPAALHEAISEPLPLYHFVSGFSHPFLPVITSGGIRLFQWGLIPFWVKDAAQAASMRSKTLNAVGETVFEKASFKYSIRKHRCLLPVSGFFEWREFRKRKYPYYIYASESGLFSLGCIHASWTDKSSGEIFQTFSILTTPANPLMAAIHNKKQRMPLIIPAGKEAAWLDAGLDATELRKLIQAADDKQLSAHPVSRELNHVRAERNTPRATEAINYPELPPLPLA